MTAADRATLVAAAIPAAAARVAHAAARALDGLAAGIRGELSAEARQALAAAAIVPPAKPAAEPRQAAAGGRRQKFAPPDAGWPTLPAGLLVTPAGAGPIRAGGAYVEIVSR